MNENLSSPFILFLRYYENTFNSVVSVQQLSNDKFRMNMVFSTVLIHILTIISAATFYQPLPSHTDLKNRMKPHRNHRILICPGFGHSHEDYSKANSLVPSLVQKGWEENQIRVLPISKLDWLNVFIRGICDVYFWQGNASPTRPAFRWYLNLVANEIHKFILDDDHVQVILIGHSAGGWLARAAIGFLSGEVESIRKVIDLQNILGIVTLGSPHVSPPHEVFDITRGALRLVGQ